MAEESNSTDSESVSLSSSQEIFTAIRSKSMQTQTENILGNDMFTQTLNLSTIAPQMSAISMLRYSRHIDKCYQCQLLAKRKPTESTSTNSLNRLSSAHNLLQTPEAQNTHENRHSPLAAIISALFFVALFAWTYWNSEILFGYLPHCLRIYVATRMRQIFDTAPPPEPVPVRLAMHEVWLDTATAFLENCAHVVRVFLDNLLYLQRYN